jgi:Glycosyl hydrolase 36 superfamily, catalytic domain/Glycosyltransferase family 36
VSVNRREFLSNAALTAAALKANPRAWALAQPRSSSAGSSAKSYGSGSFGDWIEDEFGLPAFHYACDQISDPKAVTRVNFGVLTSTEHIFQIGNGRVVAVASNYGHVRVRQDEGAPKFLNDYDPDRGWFAGGFGYLVDGNSTLSTHYPGRSKSFDRIFGAGYFRKKVAGESYTLDHVILAPFGDDPILLSQVTITYSGHAEANLRWIEYWGCQLYQFSFRSFMEMFGGKSMHELRRDFGTRFSHAFRPVADGAGLVESKEFLGRDPVEDKQFQGVVGFLEKTPNPFLAAPAKDLPRSSSFDDLNPPSTFLISLDAPADAFSTDGKKFFGAGGLSHPDGLQTALDGNLGSTGPDSALLLERKFTLKPGESKTLSFLYGYMVSGFDLDTLVSKYRQSAPTALRDSSAQWKKSALHFSTPDEPWIERETTWNYYSLRSGFSYDDFFHEHIVSQASIYQYVMGFQGAARDPLQHVLPFIFTEPGLVREVLRYTLKEVRPDGSIPYGIVGHGMPMPTVSDNSSDMPMWLIWAVSEYILATRDLRFLDSDVVTAYGGAAQAEHWEGANRASVRALLVRCFNHLVNDVKTGEHGLMRMLQDDWNDALVQAWVPPASVKECLEKGESVLNSAMAAYVFDYYARMLAFAGDDERITTPIRAKAEEHRAAVQRQWTGKWFKRAWLGPTEGWLGEKGLWIEPQPWAIIGATTSEEQTHTLIQSMDQNLRRVSPIGAVQLSDSPDRIGHGTWHTEPGTSVAGGVWPSLNQTLIWALARIDPAMAWDEWKKNSFARHAEVYPQIWYGTWSGPDVLNSVSSKHPGETTGGKPFGWTDFPVLNMHTHACPLYSAAKLLGLEFTETGIGIAPGLPVSAFRFESPLLGVVKSPNGYEGWYAPSNKNTWSVRVRLSRDEMKHFKHVQVNGNKIRAREEDGALEFRGEGGGGTPLRWSLLRS